MASVALFIAGPVSRFFFAGIIAGRVWVCIPVIVPIVIPSRAMLGALLFGGVFALHLRLQKPRRFPFEVFWAARRGHLIALASRRNAAYPEAYLSRSGGVTEFPITIDIVIVNCQFLILWKETDSWMSLCKHY